MAATWMMQTIYIPQGDTPAESRFMDSPPPDQPPAYLPSSCENTVARRAGVTRPQSLFNTRISRQVKRLEYQVTNKLRGRRQTLPFDPTCDLLANAENNIFGSWATAGICPPEWGSPWPSGTKRWSRKKLPGGPQVGARWPHEEYVEPVYGLDLSASRPSRVFELECEEEFKWLRDEAEFRRRDVDEYQLRQESLLAVRTLWTKDKLWDPRWSEVPGDKWAHEEQQVTPVTASPPPTYAELFGLSEPEHDPPSQPLSVPANRATVLAGARPHVEESISRQAVTASRPRRKKHQVAVLRRSPRIAALNETRREAVDIPFSVTASISKMSQGTRARAHPSRTRRTRR